MAAIYVTPCTEGAWIGLYVSILPLFAHHMLHQWVEIWHCKLLLSRLNSFCLTGSTEPKCIIVPNFVQIGTAVYDILQIFHFEDGGCRHFVFLKVVKSYRLLGSGGPRCIIAPNFVKIKWFSDIAELGHAQR